MKVGALILQVTAAGERYEMDLTHVTFATCGLNQQHGETL
jgi:hypothetical protein